MGLSKNTPVFLDASSGFNSKQIKQINLVIRIARRAFEAKAKQNQLSKPDIERLTISKYNRVLNLKDYLYNRNFSISFILNPIGFEEKGEYPLLETDKTVSVISIEGSNSETEVANSLSSLGYLKISNKGSLHNVIYFVCTTSDWPTDEDGNKVQYSAFISGVIE